MKYIIHIQFNLDCLRNKNVILKVLYDYNKLFSIDKNESLKRLYRRIYSNTNSK